MKKTVTPCLDTKNALALQTYSLFQFLFGLRSKPTFCSCFFCNPSCQVSQRLESIWMSLIWGMGFPYREYLNFFFKCIVQRSSPTFRDPKNGAIATKSFHLLLGAFSPGANGWLPAANINLELFTAQIYNCQKEKQHQFYCCNIWQNINDCHVGVLLWLASSNSSVHSASHFTAPLPCPHVSAFGLAIPGCSRAWPRSNLRMI